MGSKATIHQLNVLRKRVEETPPGETSELAGLRQRIAELEAKLNQEFSAWDHVKLSRHPDRPYTLDYVERIFSDFSEIHGDRKYGDDPAIVGGMALLEQRPVMVVGQQKGRNTSQRIFRNYGMPKPEGYRKAIRLMQLAEKFERPIFCFVDTPGAYPGIGAEERGQAEAIAANLRAMAVIRVPIVVTVIGEGGSGGALAIGIGDRVLMLEHSIYSVISPESCSAILWRDQDHAEDAARALKLTAADLERFSVVDEVVKEPPGGAHHDHDAAAGILKGRLIANLEALDRMSVEERLAGRYDKFRRIGFFSEDSPA